MKVLKRAAVAAAIVFAVIQLIPVDRTNPPVTREVRWNAPETRALAQRACFDCHSNETVWPWTSRIAPATRSVNRPGLVTKTLALQGCHSMRARIRLPQARVMRCSMRVVSDSGE